MSDLLISEVEAEPKRSVRATVRNFEKIVDGSSGGSPDGRPHVSLGNNSPDTRPKQIHKLKFLGGEHKSFESSSPPVKDSVTAGDDEVKEGVPAGEEIMTLAERLEALQSSSMRAFEPSRSTKINAQPISRIRESLRQSMDNLQQMRPPKGGVRTVSDIRDAIRKSRENLNDDDGDSTSKSDGQLHVCGAPAAGVKKPRPAPRKSKMVKLIANRSQSCENLLAGDDELVALTSPPKSTKSFTKADGMENLRDISDVKLENTTVRSKSDVQSSIRRASYRAAERVEIVDKRADKPKKNVAVKTTKEPGHLSTKHKRPAEISEKEVSEASREKSDTGSGVEENEFVEGTLDKTSYGSTDSQSYTICHIQSVDLIEQVTHETKTSLALPNDAELCPTSDDISDSTNHKKHTDTVSPSCVNIQHEVSAPENVKKHDIRRGASMENIASASGEQISYDPTVDLKSILPLGPIHEELEYDQLSRIFVENILDEQRNLSQIISPPRDFKTTVEYMYPLFKISDKELMKGEDIEGGEEFTDFESMKDALLSRAATKLDTLSCARDSLTTKIEELKQVESELDELVKRKADERQFGKYRSCIDEMEKVVHLLLMLSGRLARLHNNIACLQAGGEAGGEGGGEVGEAVQQQKAVLSVRYKELLVKHEDAAALKESIDHRGRQLATYLCTCLEPQELRDYQRFIATKSHFQLARQSYEDRLNQAEEQMKAIKDCRAGEVFVNLRSPTDAGTSRETIV